ncbi:MAG: hypothetical protein H0U87_08755, partial [Acidobacteria bacterium]|nr:hypothetical protein [Acidobacteriota bacterium]
MDEISPENLALLERRYKSAATVYFALLFSSVGFIVAALFLADEGRTANTDSLMPLWIAIVFIAVAAFVLRRVLINWERLRNAKLLKGVGGLLASLQTNSIVLGALAEIVALIGVAITFLNGNKFDALRAGGVALLLFAINFPRQSVWRKIVGS